MGSSKSCFIDDSENNSTVDEKEESLTSKYKQQLYFGDAVGAVFNDCDNSEDDPDISLSSNNYNSKFPIDIKTAKTIVMYNKSMRSDVQNNDIGIYTNSTSTCFQEVCEMIQSPSVNRIQHSNIIHSPFKTNNSVSKEMLKIQLEKDLLDEMYQSIKQGNLEKFSLIFQQLNRPIGEIRFSSSLTPLHLAIIYNHEAVVNHLVQELYVDLTARDQSQRTAADWAALCGHTHMLKQLQVQLQVQWQVLTEESKNDNNPNKYQDSPVSSAQETASSCGASVDTGSGCDQDITVPLLPEPSGADEGTLEDSDGKNHKTGSRLFGKKIRKVAKKAMMRFIAK